MASNKAAIIREILSFH